MKWPRWENLGEILPKEIEKFCKSFSSREKILLEVEDYAKKEKVPILLPSSAQLLRLITSIKKPKRVLEIGTGIGYSTLNIFFGYKKAEIKTVDTNKERLERAKEFFKKAKAKVEIVNSDGLDALREELSRGESYDLIFIDSAKGEYPFFHYKVQALLSRGGVAVFDNALFRGYVAGKEFEKRYERGVKLLKLFLAQVKDYPNFKEYLIPVGDGLLVLENLV
ncbi:O-methyltransferase [Thermovibrio sp.]